MSIASVTAVSRAASGLSLGWQCSGALRLVGLRFVPARGQRFPPIAALTPGGVRGSDAQRTFFVATLWRRCHRAHAYIQISVAQPGGQPDGPARGFLLASVGAARRLPRSLGTMSEREE
jgi:hypothetical protein